MKLIIVRHGQSEADILQVHEGRADFSLTEKGREQGKLLGKWIAANEDFDVIISSPLKRAKETAALISLDTKKKVIFDEALMEWNNGRLAGLSREEAAKRYPLPEGGRKPHHSHYDTESMIDFRARGEAFLSKLKEDYGEEENICIVSHGGMINMLYRSLLQLPMNTEHSIRLGDTSINKFILREGKCHIEYINRLQHLDGLE